ncbi:MAG: hypothetical protein OXB88_06725 [Bacteriovoracales bacterium]|nr:hypothetical protein [Bacteriovoracales bacterium]
MKTTKSPNHQRHAFTKKSPNRQSSIITHCLAIDPTASSITTPFQGKALWDTGATHSVVDDNVIKSLNLKSFGQAEIHGVNGPFMSDLYLLQFLLPNELISRPLEISKGSLIEGVDMLIGMDIIGDGDFAICGGQVFSFCIPPSDQPIDFVKD